MPEVFEFGFICGPGFIIAIDPERFGLVEVEGVGALVKRRKHEFESLTRALEVTIEDAIGGS